MSDTINNMDAAQYNTIINEIRKIESKIEHLETGQQSLASKIEHLETGQQKLEERIAQLGSDVRKESQGVTRWVMGLFVAALLVNGPVIGAIVSLVMMKLNAVPM